MKRYSLIYLLKEQHQHVGFVTHAEAKSLLQKMLTDPKRTPVGIYDAKTELFEWAPSFHPQFNQAGIEEQARLGHEIITIAQALRRRDSTWHPADSFRAPSFFA